MNSKIVALLLLFGLVTSCPADDTPPSITDGEAKYAEQIKKLVVQLNADRAADRDVAERELIELAGKTTAQTDHFFASLPPDSDQMPLAVRDRLARIRRKVEDQAAKGATNGTTFTLKADKIPLVDVLKALEKDTGNRLIDNREEQSSQVVTVDFKDEPFWSALDQVLDQSNLGVAHDSGEDALSIVGRGNDENPRFGTAVYRGPLRFDVVEVEGHRSLRQSKQNSLKLQIEISWEPRLRPLALSQPAGDVMAVADSGEELSISQPENVLDVEIPNGSQATEINLPFDLPVRDVKRITTLKGKLHALVPGRRAKFEFPDITKAAGKSQQLGGVKVTVDDVRKNGAVWEVHMRFAMDEASESMQSNRNWVFQNLSYMMGKDGKPIENAGFETTRQTPKEIGVAYLFDVEEGLDGLTWIYESPAMIVDLPIDYEIKEIDLP